MTLVGFLHTAAVHVATFDALMEEHPAHDAVHLVEEGLLDRARAEGIESVRDDVRRRLDELAAQGAEVVVCTCSTLGEVAEAQGAGEIEVVRVDRAMARRAVRTGERIGVVVALESTVAPTVALIEEEARLAGAAPTLRVEHAASAWARWEVGDLPGYTEAVATAARRLVGHVDVVVLAQVSMAEAALSLAECGVPVLTSPEAALTSALG